MRLSHRSELLRRLNKLTCMKEPSLGLGLGQCLGKWIALPFPQGRSDICDARLVGPGEEAGETSLALRPRREGWSKGLKGE